MSSMEYRELPTQAEFNTMLEVYVKTQERKSATLTTGSVRFV